MKRIAFAGTRGLPANYGGFETAVDEISKRFMERGYACDVFCRLSHYDDDQARKQHQGRNLIYVKGSKYRKLETVASSLQTGWYLLRHRKEYQHVFWFNNANFPGILLSLLSGVPITVNTDGLEWRRSKWGPLFKLYYFLSSTVISAVCKNLISDSKTIQDYYLKVFRKKTIFIPYGAPSDIEVDENVQAGVLSEFGLGKEKYFLQITRFEPDNLPLEIAKAFIHSRLSEKGFKFVIIGYKDETPYALKLKELDGTRGVVVLPANYDPETLYSLRHNSFCYVHGNSVGGTNPALLEAITTCPRVLAIDVPFSREVLGEHGYYFTLDTLEEIFSKSSTFPNRRQELRKRLLAQYQWNAVAESYIALVEGRDPSYCLE